MITFPDLVNNAERQQGSLGGGLGRISSSGGDMGTPQANDNYWIRITSVPGTTAAGTDLGAAQYAWEFVHRRDRNIAATSEKLGTVARNPAIELNNFSNVPKGTVVRAWVGTDPSRPALEFTYDQSDCCVGGGGVITGQCKVPAPPKCAPCMIAKVFASGLTIDVLLVPAAQGIGTCNYQGFNNTYPTTVSVSVNISSAGIDTSVGSDDGHGSYSNVHYFNCGSWDGTSCINIGNLLDSGGGGGLDRPAVLSICPIACPPGYGGGGGGGGGIGTGPVPCIPCNPATDYPCYNCQNGNFCSNFQACFGKMAAMGGGGGTGSAGTKSYGGILGGPLGGSLGSPMTSPSGGCGCSGGDCGCGGSCGGGSQVAQAMPQALATSRFGSALGGGLDGTRPQWTDIENIGASAGAAGAIVGNASGGLTYVTISDGQVLGATAGALASVTVSGGTPSVKKSADTSRASTTTFSADPDLQISLAANTVYHLKIRVDYDPGSSGLGSADFKWRLTGPASPTRVSILVSENAAGSLTTLLETPLNAYPTSRTLSTGGDQTAGMILIDMMISNGANAGTFSFDWAQGTSNVGATLVLKGSYLEYRAT